VAAELSGGRSYGLINERELGVSTSQQGNNPAWYFSGWAAPDGLESPNNLDINAGKRPLRASHSKKAMTN